MLVEVVRNSSIVSRARAATSSALPVLTARHPVYSCRGHRRVHLRRVRGGGGRAPVRACAASGCGYAGAGAPTSAAGSRGPARGPPGRCRPGPAGAAPALGQARGQGGPGRPDLGEGRARRGPDRAGTRTTSGRRAPTSSGPRATPTAWVGTCGRWSRSPAPRSTTSGTWSDALDQATSVAEIGVADLPDRLGALRRARPRSADRPRTCLQDVADRTSADRTAPRAGDRRPGPGQRLHADRGRLDQGREDDGAGLPDAAAGDLRHQRAAAPVAARPGRGGRSAHLSAGDAQPGRAALLGRRHAVVHHAALRPRGRDVRRRA